MSTITKYIGPSGDYQDFITGLTDILTSGSYDTKILYVDQGNYSGSLSFNLGSGSLHIYGDNTQFYINSISNITSSGFVYLDNFEMYNPLGLSYPLQYSSNTFPLSISNTEFIGYNNGILSSGVISLSNINSRGPGSGVFVHSNQVLIDNSNISNYGTGVQTSYIQSTDVRMSDNNISILLNVSGYCKVIRNLMYGDSISICSNSGNLDIENSSFSSHLPISANHSWIQISNSILNGDSSVLAGNLNSGVLINSDLNPGYSAGIYSITNVQSVNPVFNNPSVGDYHLKFNQLNGSPCINFIPLVSGFSLSSEIQQFVVQELFDPSKLTPSTNMQTFYKYVKKQDSTLIFSDYDQETEYAIDTFSNPSISYAQFSNLSGVISDLQVQNNFTQFPYDWDTKTFNTTRIGLDPLYIIPRTSVDISGPLTTLIGLDYFNKISWPLVTPTSIVVSNKFNNRGVAFDYDLSLAGIQYFWTIEGNNQLLNKQNYFTGEIVESYPLLTSSSSEFLIAPSGLVYNGVYLDKYQYINPRTNDLLLAETIDGRFRTIHTDIDSRRDIWGVFSYKDNLYITTSTSQNTIRSRENINTTSDGGYVLMYTNNGVPEDYMISWQDVMKFKLPDITIPTDLTIYEDGSLYIADYLSNVLKCFRFAYDYALIQTSYNSQSRVLLRENYSNVDVKSTGG